MRISINRGVTGTRRCAVDSEEASHLLRYLDGCKGDIDLTVSYMTTVINLAPPSVCREWLREAIEVRERGGE